MNLKEKNDLLNGFMTKTMIEDMYMSDIHISK